MTDNIIYLDVKVVLQMSDTQITSARPCGRVRRELLSDYQVVRDAGYSDTEIINEGIRALYTRISSSRAAGCLSSESETRLEKVIK